MPERIQWKQNSKENSKFKVNSNRRPRADEPNNKIQKKIASCFGVGPTGGKAYVYRVTKSKRK